MFWIHYSFCAPWSPCRKVTHVRPSFPGPHLFGLQFKMDCFAFFFSSFLYFFFPFVNSHLSSTYSAASFSHPAILFSGSSHLICNSDLLGQRVWRKTDLHICSTVWPVRNKWALPQKKKSCLSKTGSWHRSCLKSPGTRSAAAGRSVLKASRLQIQGGQFFHLSLKQCFSTFLMLQPFITVPHIVVTSQP